MDAILANPHDPVNDAFIPGPGEVYVPIFEDLPDVGERIVGFGLATIADVPGSGPPYAFPVQMQITKGPSAIGSENVSSGVVRAVDTALSDADISVVFEERWLIDEALQAPALVRAYGG